LKRLFKERIMSKRKKALRAARLKAEVELRASNGRATVKDVDFLTRMREINGGKDPYTGGTVPDNSPNYHPKYGNHSGWGGGNGDYQHNQRQKDMFTTSSYKPTNLPVITSKGEDGVFHCAETSELTKECPIAKVPEIFFNNRQWDILLHCTEEYDTEWIALLIGGLEEVNGKPTYMIKDFYFPPQTASGAHVDVPVEVRPKAGVIGAIHSHVGMAVFFSGTDTAHSNWPVEVVINRKREYKAVARHKLKCGEWAKNDTKVFVTGSIIPAATKAQLDLAFSQGQAMEAAKRVTTSKKGTKTTVTIPAGIAEDDKAEVAEAIVSTSTSIIKTEHPVNLNQCMCGHPKSRHGEGVHSLCLEGKCDCRIFREVFHNRLAGEDPCSNKECVREKNHKGWHRDATGSHFTTSDDLPTTDSTTKIEAEASTLITPLVTTEEEDITFPTGASSSNSLATGEGDEAFLSEEMLANIPDDLEDEDYCSNCDSTGFDSFWEKGREITIVCKPCKGSGLSPEGMAKVAAGILR
jgi:proteasome lid subunit RPN8/RPN11